MEGEKEGREEVGGGVKMAEENIGGNRCLRSMVDDGHCCRHRDIRSTRL